MEGVEAVYISQAMFRLIGKIPELNVADGEVNIAPLIQSMKGFYVLSVKDEKISKSLFDDVNKYIGKGSFELLLEAKDSGEVTRIYTAGTESLISSFVLITKDGNETSFIAFDGNMDRKQFETAIAGAAK